MRIIRNRLLIYTKIAHLNNIPVTFDIQTYNNGAIAPETRFWGEKR